MHCSRDKRQLAYDAASELPALNVSILTGHRSDMATPSHLENEGEGGQRNQDHEHDRVRQKALRLADDMSARRHP
jgi:hypothetical protein